jgi:hypothetical protein
MNAAARQLVTATLAAAAALDPTLTAERQAAAIDALDGKSLAGIVNAAPMPRILSTKQTAELLHISKDSVRYYARRGHFRRVYTGEGKGKRAIGYSAQSVRDYLEKITGDRPTEAAAV